MIETVPFRTQARTVDHLGREQIADCPTAISELWKNAYDAYARNVSLHIFDGPEPVAAVFDDGHGMSPSELTDAMRHGSGNPAHHRDASDLGRFGLGLKTASLSQCRKLTVVSKKDGIVSARRWDLDVVQDTGKWLVVVFAWAFLISYAQVYVGVHFPGDILAGMCLGSGIGLFTGYIFARLISLQPVCRSSSP